MLCYTQKALADIYAPVNFSWQILFMSALLFASAFFSGSETALFNLSRLQIKQFRRSKNKLEKIIVTLVNKPKQLLGCLLFSNILVNVSFYALSSILILKIEKQYGVSTAAVTAFLCFAMILIFGEIVPKSIAYANSKTLSFFVCFPVLLFMRFFKPILLFFHLFIVQPALNLILGPQKAQKKISTSEFSTLIEEVTKSGLISPGENRLMENVVELGFLKVRHVMKPRVDMLACDVKKDDSKTMRSVMQKNHVTRIPVYVEKIDNIIGVITLRQLLLKPDTPIDRLIQRAGFVPEQKSVESLIEFFRSTKTDTAIVVDEFGGIAGTVRLEDIVEQLLGTVDISKVPEPISRIGPAQYRLNGDLAVRQWAQTFGINPADTRIATLGGLVTALLGKIPRVGDIAYLNNLKFTVESIQKRRIETLILTLEPSTQNDR